MTCKFVSLLIHKNCNVDEECRLIRKAKELAEEIGGIVEAFVWGEPSQEIQACFLKSGADLLNIIEISERLEYNENVSVLFFEKTLKGIQPDILLTTSNCWGRMIASRLASRLDTGLSADCIDLEIDPKTGKLLQKRVANNGGTFAVIISTSQKFQMATVKSGVLNYVPRENNETGKVIFSQVEDVAEEETDGMVLKDSLPVLGRNQEIVLGCGRGISSKENMMEVFQFAQDMKWGFAVTRPLVDQEWCDAKYQIGQSGNTISSKWYLAFGISGTTQHMIGISRSTSVIAINPDKNAEILNYAAYAVQEDAMQVLKKIRGRLR